MATAGAAFGVATTGSTGAGREGLIFAACASWGGGVKLGTAAGGTISCFCTVFGVAVFGDGTTFGATAAATAGALTADRRFDGSRLTLGLRGAFLFH